MLQDSQQAPPIDKRQQAAHRLPQRALLVTCFATLGLALVGCKATPFDHWQAMSSSRVQPLESEQIAALDDWRMDEPVTAFVRAGAMR
jgi:hypothetical protein